MPENVAKILAIFDSNCDGSNRRLKGDNGGFSKKSQSPFEYGRKNGQFGSILDLKSDSNEGLNLQLNTGCTIDLKCDSNVSNPEGDLD